MIRVKLHGGVLRQGLYRIIVLGDSSWNAPFWMIQGLFLGSIIVYVMMWIREKTRINRIILSVICIFLSFYVNSIACMVVIGASLHSVDIKIKKNQIVYLLILIVGSISLIMLWGLHHYIYCMVDNFIILPHIIDINQYFKMIYATAVLLMIMTTDILKKIFSNKALVYIGRISFPVFAFHWPLFCSLSTRLLCNHMQDYELWFWITLLVTLVTVLIVSGLFHITIEKWCNKLVKNIKIIAQV